MDVDHVFKRYQQRLSNAGGGTAQPTSPIADNDGTKEIPSEATEKPVEDVSPRKSTGRSKKRRSGQDDSAQSKKRRRSSRLHKPEGEDCTVVMATDKKPDRPRPIALEATVPGPIGHKPWTVVFEPRRAAQVLGSRRPAARAATVAADVEAASRATGAGVHVERPAKEKEETRRQWGRGRWRGLVQRRCRLRLDRPACRTKAVVAAVTVMTRKRMSCVVPCC